MSVLWIGGWPDPIILVAANVTADKGYSVRWVVFILLLLGTLFCLSPFIPTAPGGAWPLRPFAVDSTPILFFAGGLSDQADNAATSLLAGTGVLLFLASIAGMFWQAVPMEVWTVLVVIAVSESLLLFASYFSAPMIVPVLTDVVLLLGVLTKRWPAEVLRMRTLQNPSTEIHPLMHIPVPWVFVLAYLVGFGLQLLFPLRIPSESILFIGQVAGIVLIGAGVLLAAWCLLIFRGLQTTTIPFEPSSRLVTWGPYRFSRNPMYVSLTLLYLGEAGLLAQIWPLPFLLWTLRYINRIVVPSEEAQLLKAFRETYKSYCARVPRWM
jgi:protein-S-isoprenylcysteine O-methyltransferase Ste14